MSVKEQFYNQRPAVLFDPRASQRIDPRFTFTRGSDGTYVDASGIIRTAGANQSRIDFNPLTGECKGLLVEEGRTNNHLNSNISGGVVYNPFTSFTKSTDTSIITPFGDYSGVAKITTLKNPTFGGATGRWGSSVGTMTAGTTYTFSFFIKGEQSLVNLFRAGYQVFSPFREESDTPISPLPKEFYPNGWVKYYWTYKVKNTQIGIFYLGLSTGNIPVGTVIYTFGSQLEAGSFPTSYIPTAGSTATRAADLLSFNTDVPSSGSLYIDSQAINVRTNTTLLSVANSSDEKLLLQAQTPASLYNSLALVYAIDDTFEPTLPFPVPEFGDQRNIITWGDNNYHYQKSNYRKTPSLTASIPDDLDRIGIGHDVTDPTKGFNGTLARLYLWANELPPEIARGLVRGNITVPLNADDGNVIPVAAHALIFNTQGAAFNGDKVVRFQLLGSNNSVSIDWNDGTTETYAGSAANTTITHTYETPGLYLVTITGVFENIKLGNFTGSQASDLINVAQNGPDWSPTNLTDLYNGCTLLKNEALDDFPDTSLITQYVRAFQSCSSLTSFPLINTAAGVNFTDTWFGCSSLTSFPLINTAAGTQFARTWFGCSSLTSFPLINTAAGINFGEAWRGCSSLTSFPLIDTAAGTNFQQTWFGCNSLTSFPLINTAAGTNFALAWESCNSLTSFPLINTAAGTSFQQAWRFCFSLTSFPLINTAAGTNFNFAWEGCSSLTSFPEINTAAGTSFSAAWLGCSSLTSFPLINTAAGTNFGSAWQNCSSLTSFPEINTAAGTSFSAAWLGCSSLTSFPLINTAAGTNFGSAWQNCSSLTSFPEINTAAGTSFNAAWLSCSSLTSFPLINTAAGTNFSIAWEGCTSLTAFPALDFDAAVGLASDSSSINTGFRRAWNGCTSLADFPANLFDSTTCTRYLDAFTNCALTAQSIENILVSINTANTSNGNLSLQGGTNAVKTSWTANANTAYDALVARGWTITFRP
jgi:hypothetical protein